MTEVDPGRADLLFERFISPERREPPDIDVDFEHERREEVIQYIYGKYGRDRAGIAATVISYRGRSAIREVGKAFGLSEDAIGALSSSIWGGGGGAVSKDAVTRTGLDPHSRLMRQILALAREINGFPRHLSQHVGGFVITRSRLDEVMPIGNAAMDERTFVEWTRTISTRWVFSRSTCSDSACCRACARRSIWSTGITASDGRLPPSRPKTLPSTTCSAARIHLACSRWKAARR